MPTETSPGELRPSRFLAETDLAVSFADPGRPDSPLAFVNDAFCRLTGYAREECIDRNCRFLQGADTDPEAVRRVRDGIAAERFQVTELDNYRRPGGRFVNALLIGPVRRPDGSLHRLFGMQWDIEETLQRRRQTGEGEWWHRDFRRQLDHFESLVEHLASLCGRGRDPSAGIEVVERLVAVSRPQQYPPTERLPNWMQASALLRYLMTPYVRIGTGSLRLDGDLQIVAADVAPPIALAVHELAARTLAFGEASGRASEVSLGCEVAMEGGEPVIRLRWSSRAGGTRREATSAEPSADEPRDAGLDLVSDVAARVGGRFEHRDGETSVEAVLSLPNRPIPAVGPA